MRRYEHIVRCAAIGCSEIVRPGMLMCRGHWLALPKGLRREIHEAWRARQTGNYQRAVRRAVEMLERAESRFTGIFEGPVKPLVPVKGPTAAKKRVIGRMYRDGDNTRAIAAQFGLSPQRVSQIARELKLPMRRGQG